MTVTQYKLKNVNSRKKTFNSIQELKDYVEEKDLRPRNMTDAIMYDIVKTTSKTMKVKVEKPSDEMVVKLLNKMKSKLSEGLAGYAMLFKEWSLERFLDDPVLTHLHNALINNEFLIKGGIEQDVHFKGEAWYELYPIIKKSMIEFFDFLIDNIDTLELNCVKQITDFRDCNGYGFKFEYHEAETAYLMVRKEDVLFNRDPIFGRNINCSGMSVLTDNDINKALKI